jgi:hypothetical protein
MNVSAATGKSLSQVTAALSRAYAGNTTGLSRLGAGLDKALLKAGDMDAIMAELNNKFAGQAQARLSTYAGQMDLLRVASENAKEEIGEGLLLALQAIGKDNSIDEVTRKMENLGKSTGKTIEGLGVLIGEIKSIPGAKTLGDIVFGTNIFNMLNKLAQENSKGRFPTAPARETPAQGRILAAQRRQEIKASQDLLKLKKQEVTTLKAKTAIDQLKDKFDIERIGLTKALNEATDSETKLRLRAQLAILDNNEALAKKLLAEMEGKKATEELTTQFYALSEAAKNLLLSFGVSPNQIGPGGTITGTGGGGRMGNLADVAINNPYFGYSDAAQQLGLALGFTPAMSQSSSPEIRITVDTAATGDKLSQAIAESIQVATRNGYSTVPAGQGF